MNDTATGLLEGVGIGEEELRDPREGEYFATIKDVRLVANSAQATIPYAIVVTYDNMEDSEGRTFSLDDRINIPQSNSTPVVQRMFLATLHTLGLVSRADRRPRFADTDEQRAAVLQAFKSLEGSSVPIRVVLDGGGYPRVRLLRS